MAVENKREAEFDGVAVVGMACRIPGARNVEEFWRNLREGVESISFFTEEELRGVVDAATLRAPNFVRAKGVLEDCETFDASFFGFSPREAEMMDPQQRVFLECVWHALEDAGYDPETYEGAVGLFAGASTNTYLLNNLLSRRELIRAVGNLQTSIQNRTDHLTTRAAYELGLKGPAVTVQTACSTSLVAVHLACQSLLGGECDAALAGGVSVSSPPRAGYTHQAGGILSSDGHCRAFDADADGTVDGDGVGVVVLRRLADALADGDRVLAVIRGSAVNNDGSLKVGFTAPSVQGQAAVIAEAQAVAGVEPESITYVEAHGTGTPLGDPIEIEALTEAFRARADKKGSCAVGSVKTNIGHLDAAAGVAGLIKTVLALTHKEIPPSLHFKRPNPNVGFEGGPFYVNASLAEWPEGDTPRRAGVSSFGIGGTNAHVIVEEPPAVESEPSTRPAHLLVLSARTGTALDAATMNLIAHLREHPEANLADVAHTLQAGRKAFDFRRVAVCRDAAEAVRALETLDHRKVFTGLEEPRERPVVMMFPGQGSQFPGMGAELYESEPVFRQQLDACAESLRGALGLDLRELLFPAPGREEEARRSLERTELTQPALFVTEYALARLWMSRGVSPAAMIGHSLGEYVAACLSGVFELGDALALVAERGRLMQSLPEGSMLAVPLSEEDVRGLIGVDERLSLASINAPSLCVVSGEPTAVEDFERAMEARGVACRRLHTSHAFHSRMMEPILEEFAARVARVKLSAPRIPYISNVTGTWATEAEATDPRYWSRHLREPVRFNAGAVELFGDRERVFLEVGPGRTLSTLLRQHPQKGTTRVVLSSLRHAGERGSDAEMTLSALGRLWLTGARVDWGGLYEGEPRLRASLPAYPFERQRYWVEPSGRASGVRGERATDAAGKRPDVAEWFYTPFWKRTRPAPAPAAGEPRRWLLFMDECGLGARVAALLASRGEEVVTVSAASSFGRLERQSSYRIAPAERGDYDALLRELKSADALPTNVVHLWNVTADEAADSVASPEELERRGFYSLLYLAQALGNDGSQERLRLCVVTTGAQEVTGGERLRAEKALASGPCLVIPQEYPHINCRHIDVTPPAESDALDALCVQLIAEAASDDTEGPIAYRGRHRWVRDFESLRLEAQGGRAPRLRERGVYLVTGGLGGMALELACHLAETTRARLALVGRTALPPRERWPSWVAERGEDDATSRRIRRVEELERAGAEVLTLAADVSDAEQFGAAVAEARSRFGAINGVIHAAGVAGGGVIQLKTAEAASRVLAPKVRGTRVIEAAFEGEPLDFLMLCSSRSSILGGFGQIDYCAANAFLDAFAHERAAKSPDTLTVSLDWDAWTAVGMFAAAAAQYGLREGQALAAGRETGHPLLDRQVSADADRKVYATTVSPSTHWVLDDHRIVGAAIMPGTAYLEMARAALERSQAQPAGTSVEIRDAFFLAPLGLRNDEEKEVRTIVEREGDGLRFRVVSAATAESASGDGWQNYSTGWVGYAAAEPPQRLDLAALRERCAVREIVITDEDEIDPDLGPRWQSLRRVHLGDGELLAALELPEEFAADFEQFGLHPALLDRATGTAKHYLVNEGHYLPMSYKSLRVTGRLPRRIFAHIRFRDDEDAGKKETITFDIILTDEEGVERVRIDGFSQKRVNDTAAPLRTLDGVKRQRAAAQADAQTAHAAPSVYEKGLHEGILPREGSDAFARVVAAALVPPQIVVSTRDLHGSMEEMRALTTTSVVEEIEKLEVARPAGSHPRPEVEADYVAPRDEVERTLVEIFQTMLGIERVGVRDNFFELGGDSVLGIQIIAQANRAGLRLTPQQIFQHPTVEEMAAVAQGVEPPAAQEPTPAATPSQARPTQPASEVSDFSLARLGKEQLDKLSALIGEGEGEEEDDEQEEATAAAAAAAAGAGRAAGAPQPQRATAAAVEAVLRQHPDVREASVVARGAGEAFDAYVVLRDEARARASSLDFSLFFFAADNLRPGEDKYRLYLEGAKYADRHGFSAVWTPERHFHESGGLYPNPSVLSAALAVATERVGLRSGSVVMPLHHSIRVAEEWAVVDNLSGGRVGLSFTSGWIPNDFAFFPERFPKKREEMFRGIEEVRALWRGEAVEARDGAGNTTRLRVLPRPLQAELPVWLTCSGDPEMFVKAGELGFNVLTALLTQSVEDVAKKVALYREARGRAGHDPDAGHVTLMMHTFLGGDLSAVVSKARGPLCDYLKAHVGLIETMTKSLDIDVGIDREKYLDDLVAFAFERYYQTASLIGTPEKCMPLVERVKSIGVNEVACFVDFGVDTAAVLESSEHLRALKEMSSASNGGGAASGARAAQAISRFVGERLPGAQFPPASVQLVESLPAAGGAQLRSS
jgi:phthiocerol/phenolphthiocerol synthesis type-I polyketide synthase E